MYLGFMVVALVWYYFILMPNAPPELECACAKPYT